MILFVFHQKNSIMEIKTELIHDFMSLGNDIEGRVSFLYKLGEDFPFSGRTCEELLVEGEVQDEIEEFGSTLSIETFSYHNSWDWLMLVVEKVEEMGFSVDIFMSACSVHKLSGETIVDIGGPEVKGQPKIKAVYKAMVEFIEWYNQNKK